MNQIVENNIENLIYEIRGRQVMLDSDLAKLYNVETKRINEAVNRNIERFPKDFYFQLTKEELEHLQFQNGTANFSSMNRSLPHVFTEEGVAMLSSVLRTFVATNVSVKIMRCLCISKKKCRYLL